MDNNQNKEYQAVVLAALLHDIGKFMQRANKYLCNESKDKITRTCQLNECDGIKKGADYRHICHSYWFLFEHKEILPTGIGEKIAKLSFMHHDAKDDPLEVIVKMSDHFSAGCDRIRKEISNSHYYKRQPLRSIFDKVQFSSGLKEQLGKETFYDIAKLSPDSVFPQEHAGTKEKQLYLKEWQQKWDRLVIDFENDFVKLKYLPFDRFIIALNSTLERYTWCIPSSTWLDEPDISLYDHLVTSASLAAAMYEYYKKKYGNNINTWDVKSIGDWKEEIFLFVSGDLSGIQDYLFDLRHSKFSAKILRARSFELQMLSEASIRYILQRAGLPPICRIMNAAGRFILVLPNIEDSPAILQKVRADIEAFCKDRYMGQLTVNLSQGVQASGDFMRQENTLDMLFADIARDVDNAKQLKFRSILKNLDDFFIKNDYEKFKSTQDLCPICRKRPIAPKSYKNEEDENYCEICQKLISLGGELTKAKYVAWVSEAKDAHVWLPGNMGLKLLREKGSYYKDVTALKKYDPCLPFLNATFHVPTDGEGATDLIANAKSGIRIKTFEEIAREADGDKKIGMFKADVDNLGSIFSIGMGGKVSISRFATLSRIVNYFFTAYVNQIIASSPVFQKCIYTVFSGGDDLCIIGPWDKIIDFALLFNKKFTEFVGENSKVTVSGGITIANQKLPSRNLVIQANDFLQYSKRKDSKKNKVTVFNTTVEWNKFGELIDTGHKFEEYLQEGSNFKTSKGIFYRLLDYGEKAKALEMRDRDINPKDTLWISHLNYDVARNIAEMKKVEFTTLAYTNIKEIRLPVSYVLYKTRKGGT